MMVQRREMTKTAVASRKIEHQPGTWEVVWTVVIFVVHVGEIWVKRFICRWRPHTPWKCTMGC